MEFEEFKQKLQKYTKQPINLILTTNRRIVFSFNRGEGNEINVRINKIFLNSTQGIIKAIAEFILRRTRKSKNEIKKFIRLNQDEIDRLKPVRRRKIFLFHQGVHFNLKEIFDKINNKYFSNKIDCRISWGKYPKKVKRKKSIRYGAFIQEKNLIMVSRVLDNDFIPDFFIEYIVYHEMLHAYFFNLKNSKIRLTYPQMQINFSGLKVKSKRPQIVHDAEFKLKEREFAEYERKKKWGKENLEKMLKL